MRHELTKCYKKNFSVSPVSKRTYPSLQSIYLYYLLSLPPNDTQLYKLYINVKFHGWKGQKYTHVSKRGIRKELLELYEPGLTIHEHKKQNIVEGIILLRVKAGIKEKK